MQRTEGGGEYVFNRNEENDLKTTMKETTVNTPFHLNIENQNNGAYLVTKQQHVNVQRDTTNVSVYGNPCDGQEGVHLQEPYRRQRNNNNKQTGPASIHGNMNLLNSDINMSLNNKCLSEGRTFVHGNGPYGVTPSYKQLGVQESVTQSMCYNKDKIGTDRINPDLLQAFKQNPYTQSLASYGAINVQ